MINFNEPPHVEKGIEYIKDAIRNKKICGDGKYTRLCSNWMEERFNSKRALLTTSCTHALEMAAILCNVKEGDEVIMPSFTFVSTADAFVMRGAKIVFVDIRPDTMNIDESLIEQAVTDRTKVIVPVHYAGVSCEMDKINLLAKRHKLFIVEDAAQGIMSTYKGRSLGTIGDFGCYSFHETKNYSMGEGGAILIQNIEYAERAEIIREKGTNRSQFFRGQVDKYTWMDIGSSYLPSELNAAYLCAQFEVADRINEYRLNLWNTYYEDLKELENEGIVDLPFIPSEVKHNGHMFYIKVQNLEVRSSLISYLKQNDILAVFHYIPLHSAPAGLLHGRFSGEDVYTTRESERLLRLPMYYGLQIDQIHYITGKIKEFFITRN